MCQLAPRHPVYHGFNLEEEAGNIFVTYVVDANDIPR